MATSPAQENAPVLAPDVGDPQDGDSTLGDEQSFLSSDSLASSILRYREINGRTYHNLRGPGNYYGANDEKQKNTIDLQHHVLTLALEGKLHLAPLPDTVGKVVDVGTGTGIWAIDFGDAHPEATVTGFDLSPIQPSLVDDFLLDWTFEENSLDFVYMRWLVGCVPDWAELCKNAYRCLKPGGWIESFDSNGYYLSDDGSVKEGTAIFQYGEFFRLGAEKIGLKASFHVVRDELQRKGMEAAGFVNIHEKNIKVPGSEWPRDPKQKEIGMFAQAAVDDIEGLVSLMATELGWTPAEITVMAAKMRRELRDPNIHPHYVSKAVWAQKPVV
ncbi:methyltransferase type 11 [Grosmannia clavigera kw1407]|uniref:Methyltransferase type 11 n=1 Tax=Grosmannia clavigera (strain kw1407 / UAMH 11150) TaxID=655863 RepID=F0XES9_GROCL|nr:methyltransferase type 11 [Grosmannia clavigera kw1407]EFX03766.1 methyltransferase type 11 [Grosmannia clavigera kw1407]